MNSRSAKGTPTRRRSVEPDRRKTGVVSKTGSGIISEFGNQGSDGNRPDRVTPRVNRDPARPRRGAAPKGEPRTARDRDAWNKGADRDAIGAKPIGKRKRRVAEMRARKRKGNDEGDDPGSGLLGNVTRAGGAALRRVGRLGAPIGAGFRALRGAATTGAWIARGVTEAMRERLRGKEYEETFEGHVVEPEEDQKPETDLQTMGAEVATEETKREYKRLPIGGAQQKAQEKQPAPKPKAKKKKRKMVQAVVTPMSDDEAAPELATKGATKKYSPHPTGSNGNARRSTRRRATKNAGSRRR